MYSCSIIYELTAIALCFSQHRCNIPFTRNLLQYALFLSLCSIRVGETLLFLMRFERNSKSIWLVLRSNFVKKHEYSPRIRRLEARYRAQLNRKRYAVSNSWSLQIEHWSVLLILKKHVLFVARKQHLAICFANLSRTIVFW